MLGTHSSTESHPSLQVLIKVKRVTNTTQGIEVFIPLQWKPMFIHRLLSKYLWKIIHNRIIALTGNGQTAFKCWKMEIYPSNSVLSSIWGVDACKNSWKPCERARLESEIQHTSFMQHSGSSADRKISVRICGWIEVIRYKRVAD